MADVLAPIESGAQLLCLPAEEIESRCLITPRVTVQQAKAFRSKLWQTHIDSLNTPASISSESAKPDVLGPLGPTSILSSRDLDPTSTEVPFKERLRPGMVVSWNEPHVSSSAVDVPGSPKLAVILCPVEAVLGTVKDVHGNLVNPTDSSPDDTEDNNGTRSGAKYLCALVTPAVMADAYDLNLWRQIVVDVSVMEKEVLLEYDAATRYYYTSL